MHSLQSVIPFMSHVLGYAVYNRLMPTGFTQSLFGVLYPFNSTVIVAVIKIIVFSHSRVILKSGRETVVQVPAACLEVKDMIYGEFQ